MRIACSVILLAVLLSPSLSGHPHPERQIVTLRGTLTKVDTRNGAVELDTIDPETKMARNLLLFVGSRAKLRNGKAKIALGELKAGQRVSATVEVTHDEEQAERFVALEIKLR